MCDVESTIKSGYFEEIFSLLVATLCLVFINQFNWFSTEVR